jgi:tetratricopeptide (TPR) repeat protein
MQKETFPQVVSLESLDAFNRDTANLVFNFSRIKSAWKDSVLLDRLKSSKSEVLNSREMAIALRTYLYLDKDFNSSIDNLFLTEHKDVMEQALRLAFRDYLNNPEHKHWKYILEEIKELPQWKDFYEACDYFASEYKKLQDGIENCWESIKHISFKDAIIAVSILHWQAISSKEILPHLTTRTAYDKVLLSQQGIVTALGKYLKRIYEEKGSLDLNNFEELHLYMVKEISRLIAIEEQGKETELDNVWKYIQALYTMGDFMQNSCSTFMYESSLQVDIKKDDEETNLKNGIFEYIAQKIAAENIYKDLEKGAVFGSKENHILNQNAYTQALSEVYILKQFYGVSDNFTYNGHKYNLFEILHQAEMLRMLFDSEFLKKWEEFNPSMSSFIFDGINKGKERLPVWFETFSSLAEKCKTKEHTPDKENFSLLSIDVNQEKSKFDLLLYPILRYEENLIIFPFMYALFNPHISILNLLRQNKENNKDSQKERIEETKNIEKIVAKMPKPIIDFQKAKIWTNEKYGEKTENEGEFDVVLYANKTLLIIEVKSVYRCNTMEDRYKHEKQLRHAGHQLNRNIKALREDQSLLSKITGDNLIKFADIRIETLIISTSFEFDHQRFSGHLKISLLEWMILFGYIYPDQLFGARTPFLDVLKDFDMDLFNKLQELQANMPKSKEEQDRQIKEAKAIMEKIEQRQANIDYSALFPHKLNVQYKEPTIEHLMDCLNSNSVWEWVLPYWHIEKQENKATENYEEKSNVSDELNEEFGKLLNAGEKEIELKHFDKALEYFYKALKISINDAMNNACIYEINKAYNNKGLFLDERNNCYEAIECYKRAIEISPQDDKAFANLGTAYEKIGQLQKAEESYLKSVEINPKNADTYYSIGLLYQNQGKYKEAIKNYETAISINPDDSGAWINMGALYLNFGYFQQAIFCNQKAYEIEPNNEILLRNMYLLNCYMEAIYSKKP